MLSTLYKKTGKTKSSLSKDIKTKINIIVNKKVPPKYI